MNEPSRLSDVTRNRLFYDILDIPVLDTDETTDTTQDTNRKSPM